jgi:hypothetical protein
VISQVSDGMPEIGNSGVAGCVIGRQRVEVRWSFDFIWDHWL